MGDAQDPMLSDNPVWRQFENRIEQYRHRGYQIAQPLRHPQGDYWGCNHCGTLITNPDKHDQYCPARNQPVITT